MIGLVHYGVGNIGSLGNAWRYLGIPFIASSDPDELSGCNQLVLPGVGAFGPAMECIRRCHLEDFLAEWALSGKPLLGICLGMQLLLTEGREGGLHRGLGLIPGTVEKITGGPRKVHMGWNLVKPTASNSIARRAGYAYFVHSYRCLPLDKDIITAQTFYGGNIAAVIHHENILGIQFHPEKSAQYGLDYLRSFADGNF